jgi:hypothetical protein
MNRNLLINSVIATLAFWFVIGVLLYRRHVREAAQEQAMRDLMELDYTPAPPPCLLQMDKTKPNYNDCGASTEPVSPATPYDQPPKDWWLNAAPTKHKKSEQ